VVTGSVVSKRISALNGTEPVGLGVIVGKSVNRDGEGDTEAQLLKYRLNKAHSSLLFWEDRMVVITQLLKF
jgi:hypothetical protein